MFLLSLSGVLGAPRHAKISEIQNLTHCHANLRTASVASETISALDAVVELAMS